MSALPQSGIVLIDKAQGWTSHDVVAAMRAVLGARRVGHGGTLDPLATGLLPIVYGKATRLADDLHRAPKAYLAEMVLGSETTTDDAQGETAERAPVPALDDARVRDVFAAFVGKQPQRPPRYSALKLGGVRAYTLARRGEEVDLAPREIEIHELDLVERTEVCVHFLVTCSSGTYVRALARDLGRALDTRAHLGALRRVAAGGLWVEDAIAVEEARELAAAGALAPIVYAPDTAALDLPGAILARDAARRLLHGGRVAVSHLRGRLRAYDVDGRFLGVAESEDGMAGPRTMVAD